MSLEIFWLWKVERHTYLFNKWFRGCKMYKIPGWLPHHYIGLSQFPLWLCIQHEMSYQHESYRCELILVAVLGWDFHSRTKICTVQYHVNTHFEVKSVWLTRLNGTGSVWLLMCSFHHPIQDGHGVVWARLWTCVMYILLAVLWILLDKKVK